MTTITATEFKKRINQYIDEPLKEIVYITKDGRRVAALIDAVELERFITDADNRQSYFIKDLPADAIAALENGPQAPARPELNHLMEQK